jgi:pteridine reductase
MHIKNKERKMAALITGSSRRIGAVIVKNLHTSGMDVGIHYNSSKTEATSLCAELNELRPNSASIFSGDITLVNETENLVKDFISWSGRIDLLVNNASSFYPTPIGTITENHWNDLIGTNLKGPLFITQAASDALRKAHGSVINLIDVHTRSPLKNHPAYSSAKAGLKMLTRSLAKDLAPEIRVNGISPGAILWPEDGISEEAKKSILEQIPLNRTGSPQDIADCVLFLLNQANYITGQIIAVDGGRSV